MQGVAMDVLNRLVQEDDQSVEAWYLGGWCQSLISIELKAATSPKLDGDPTDAEQTIEDTMKGSRHWLETSMKLYELLDYEDDRLFDHAKELVTELDMVLGMEDEQAEGGEEEYGDEWDGIDGDENGDAEMADM